MASSMKAVLGLENKEKAFNRGHGKFNHAFKPKGDKPKTTIPVQTIVERAIKSKENPEELRVPKKRAKELQRKYLGFYQKRVLEQGQLNPDDYSKDEVQKSANQIFKSDVEVKAPMDSGTIETPTPLVYDPQILQILKQNAPLVARVPEEGQQGFKAIYNAITERDSPIGMVSETESANLLDTGKTITFNRDEQSMKIFVDTIDISDFAQQAASHYVNLEDTTLNERLTEYSQFKEQMFLYGDPSQALSDGSPGDSNAYPGLHKIADDAGNTTDKSGTSTTDDDWLLADIKSELSALLQGDYAINLNDMEIWTSHTVFEELENELQVKVRISQTSGEIDYGFGGINIRGVEVVPSHNVDSQSYGDGSYSPGSEGDVFLTNMNSVRFRSLSPLSTIPLTKRGLASESALFEFGALIARGQGNLTYHLEDYPVTSLTS